jgi:hypothetical protein
MTKQSRRSAKRSAPQPDTPPEAPRKRGAPTGNQNALKHGFYSGTFTREELALVAAFVRDPSINDEVWMQRVMNHRLVKYVGANALSAQNLVSLAMALTAGTGRVSRLLRDQRVLSGEAADSLAEAIAAALDELSAEWGIDL